MRTIFIALPLAACAPEKSSPVDEDGDGFVLSEDCDDTDAAVNPDATERCDDQQIDENCNGLADDEDPELDESSATPWFSDADGDGLGVGPALVRCLQPAATSPNDGDCDDTDAAVLLGQEWFEDADGDGVGSDIVRVECDLPAGFAAAPGDCDDSDPTISPNAEERCDVLGLDEDCDGLVDDLDPSVAEESKGTWYEDVDGDGYGAGDAVYACSQPPGMSDNGVDCDDTNALRHPLMEETCTGVDDDCDGFVDDEDSDWDFALGVWQRPDIDEDGVQGGPAWVCAGKDGWASPQGPLVDCDDDDPEVSPLADEICEDGVDNDCDTIDTACWGDTGELGTTDDAEIVLTDVWGPASVVEDLDGDGRDELFIGTRRVIGPLSPGTMTLDSVALPSIQSTDLYPVILGAADANRDGVLDLVFGDDQIEVWLGPDFDAAAPFCSWELDGPYTVGKLLVDANGDGWLDYLATDFDAGVVSITEGVCGGPELVRLEGPANEHFGVEALVGDFDGDGENTLVVKSSTTALPWDSYTLIDEPWVTGPVSATAPVFLQEDLRQLVVADFSGDGTDELLFEWYNQVYAGYGGPQVGGLTLSQGVSQVTDFGFEAVLSPPGDINGDGHADVLVSEPSGLLVGTGSATGLEFNSALPLDLFITNAVLWDANFDGYDDVVVETGAGPLNIMLGGPGF